MSRAFVKERDDDAGITVPDRPISVSPNLVTPRGLALIDAISLGTSDEYAVATGSGDAAAQHRIARELRYWRARRASARIVEPPVGIDHVVIGTAVTARRHSGQILTLRIVGEDEAEPAAGRIAWTSPVARALLGSGPGDICELPSGEVEILSIDNLPEALACFGLAIDSGSTAASIPAPARCSRPPPRGGVPLSPALDRELRPGATAG